MGILVKAEFSTLVTSLGISFAKPIGSFSSSELKLVWKLKKERLDLIQCPFPYPIGSFKVVILFLLRLIVAAI